MKTEFNAPGPWPTNWRYWWVEAQEPIACDLVGLLGELREAKESQNEKEMV